MYSFNLIDLIGVVNNCLCRSDFRVAEGGPGHDERRKGTTRRRAS